MVHGYHPDVTPTGALAGTAEARVGGREKKVTALQTSKIARILVRILLRAWPRPPIVEP